MLDPLDTSTLQPAREAAGLSRAELAERAQLNETTVLRIETGKVDPRLSSTWAPLVRVLTVVPTADPSPGNTDHLSGAEVAA